MTNEADEISSKSKQDPNVDRERYSGQLRLRMPVSLHRQLAIAAETEGVSLNQFICAVLAAELNWSTRTQEDAESREERRRRIQREQKEAILESFWGPVNDDRWALAAEERRREKAKIDEAE